MKAIHIKWVLQNSLQEPVGLNPHAVWAGSTEVNKLNNLYKLTIGSLNLMKNYLLSIDFSLLIIIVLSGILQDDSMINLLLHTFS